MVAQLLCVQSFLLMWKECDRNKCLLSSVHFTLYIGIFYIIHLHIMAHCIRSYCNFRLEYTFYLYLDQCYIFLTKNGTCVSCVMVGTCTCRNM
jgi:hypothetical protein